MKTQIQKIIGLLTISSLLFVSCETVDFGDENLNPNSISKANTGALITGAMRNTYDYVILREEGVIDFNEKSYIRIKNRFPNIDERIKSLTEFYKQS